MTKGTVQWEKKNDFSMSGSGLIRSVYGKTMFWNLTKNYCPMYSRCKDER